MKAFQGVLTNGAVPISPGTSSARRESAAAAALGTRINRPSLPSIPVSSQDGTFPRKPSASFQCVLTTMMRKQPSSWDGVGNPASSCSSPLNGWVREDSVCHLSSGDRGDLYQLSHQALTQGSREREVSSAAPETIKIKEKLKKRRMSEGLLASQRDNALLLQTLAQRVRFLSGQALLIVTEHLSAVLVTCVYPQKPLTVKRYILPTLWFFLENRILPVRSSNVRAVVSKLAHSLYQVMGSRLKEYAASQPQSVAKNFLDIFDPT